MRIHPIDGRVAHGIAGDGVYIDGVQIAPGGGENGMPDWLGETPIWCGSAGVVGATLVRGSQVGVWAKWHNTTGVERSDGFTLPAAVLLDMAPDGTMLVGENYQSGVGIAAYKHDSTSPAWRVSNATPALFFPYSQASILDAQTACWTETVNGRRALRGFGLPAPPEPPWDVLHVRLFKVNGEPWVVYLRGGNGPDQPGDDRTIAHPWNYLGLGFSVPGFGFGPDARVNGSQLALYWSIGAGERSGDIRQQPFDLTALQDIPSLPVPPPPPPPEFFRPISEPLPKGAAIPDLSRYFIGKPETFPRTGKHTITQYLKKEGDVERVFFCKFYDPVPITAKTPFTSKAHYEELRKGTKFFHQVTDASNAPILASLTDTNWFPLEMKVGIEHGWDSGEHEIVERKSTDCQEFNRWGFTRFMAVMDAWEHFESGPDFPDIAVIKGIYDPTGGWHGPKRHLEIGYHGRDVGPLLWESYPTGPDPVTGHPGCYNAAGELVLNDTTIGRNEDGTPMRSVMYRKDPRVVDWVPDVAPCAMFISPEPEYPPMPPPPPVSSSWTMKPGDVLFADKPLVSQDKRFTLLYQSDGNLVHYGPKGPLWATGTNGQSVGFCALQGDGNFVLYDKSGKPRWSTGTNGKPAETLIVQNDGNVVIYSATAPLWATGTVYQPPAPPPIPPVPPGGVTPDMHAWPKFGASYNAGMSNPSCDPTLFAALNRDAGGNFTRVNCLDAWAVAPNGPGQYAGFLPWTKDSAGVFDLSVPDPRYDERLNYYVRAQNFTGTTVQLSLFDLYSWSERKNGLLWVPDRFLGPFKNNKNGVRWGDPEDPTYLALPDWVMLQLIERICIATKGLAVAFECGNEMPEKPMHFRIAEAFRSHFTPDWQPSITTNRQEDTPGQYFNMQVGKGLVDRIAFHGKDSLNYLDELYEDEPSSRPNTFRKFWDQSWPEGTVDPKRIIMSTDGCRINNTIECYDWPVLAEVVKDHLARGFSFEHQSKAKMRPFVEGRLDLQADFETAWLKSLR